MQQKYDSRCLLEQRSRYPQSGWRQLEMARAFNLPGDAFESSSTIYLAQV
jgi:hypothetical protein